MKKKKYIELHPKKSRKQADYRYTGIPVIGKIKEMDGKLFAEIIGYRGQWGESVSLEDSDPEKDH